MNQSYIALFKGKEVRRIIYKNEWWFSVVDIVQALVDQPDDQSARKYWNKLSQRLRDEGSEVVTFCHRLKMEAADGKMRETDCANTENIFRIVQSVPSPKAEPLKRWLAKVGFERVQEIENPELASKRTRMLYKLKGLKRENLRDHMDDFELIFNMLGERATTEIHRTENSQGASKLKADAKAGGRIAGGARKNLEKRLGRSVVSKNNFLEKLESKKRLK